MNPDKPTSRSFWLTLVAITIIFDLVAIRASILRADDLGMNLFRSAWGIVLFINLIVLLVSIWFLIDIARGSRTFFDVLSKFDRPMFASSMWRTLGLIVFAAVLFIIPVAKFTLRVGQGIESPSVDPLLVTYVYYWMSWWAILIGMAALKVALNTSWPLSFISALVMLGAAYETWLRFGAVSTYPLSMGWSEGSRYFYASLYFSKSLYGESLPLSTLHPTRYLLQSIPFLIPGLGLPAHRFWQFLLWIGMTAWATISIARRVTRPEDTSARWLIAGGAFIILLRMGVYYHLEPMVILPVAFVSSKHPVRSLLAVIAASLWAGLSRVNWFPMPAMIATAIYLLETPFSSATSTPPWKRLTPYLSFPALWMIVGLVCALVAQAAYIPLSGNSANAESFASSFTSDLLWYRLWPNPNHQQGIVPATLLFSIPLLAVIVIAARRWSSLHPIRWLGLFAMLVALFAGSLVVSAKIGGGGDLHNMDTFAVMLIIIAAYFIGGQVRDEAGPRREPVRPWAWLSLALLVPMIFILPLVNPRREYDRARNEAAYRALLQIVNDAGRNGPVLLINERQLATFDKLTTPLVADYEAVTLMEMAMSGNRAYLDRFQNDLRSHRFSVIVTNPQNVTIKTKGPLKEENNVWNTHIAPYILCYYMPVQRLQTDWNRIEIYVPNPNAKNCP